MAADLFIAFVVVTIYVAVFFNDRTAYNTPLSLPVDYVLYLTGDRPLVAYVGSIVAVAALLAVWGLWT
jgi:preprotein translocase subunit SecF